jgi:hypothetical protein
MIEVNKSLPEGYHSAEFISAITGLAMLAIKKPLRAVYNIT